MQPFRSLLNHRGLRVAALCLLGLAQQVVIADTRRIPTGTYLRPFSAQSVWNSEPVNPVLGDDEIPTSSYVPTVSAGGYSTGVFQARPSDPPMAIVGPVGAKGVWDPDAEAFRPSVTVPRWPGDVIPASQSDGHADIVDEQAGVIHSFWKLRNDNGTWRAAQYAWTELNGRGWGDPAHYFQGARAAAVPTSAGIIRKHEIDDGDTMYRHALAMSLTYNGLSKSPTFVFPATSADSDAAWANTGKIPEGALLMLPKDFDTSRLTTPALRKIAETLKTYGAYVVDRNIGTPFVIYVEIGGTMGLHPRGGFNPVTGAELQQIRKHLRPVTSVESFRGADGVCFQPSMRLNILSLRGLWTRRSGGTATGTYDSQQQALVMGASPQQTVMQNITNRTIRPVYWAKPQKGDLYEMKVRATGGAEVRIDLTDGATRQMVYTSGWLGDGGSVRFPWPANSVSTVVFARTAAGREGKVSATLIAQPAP